MDNLRIVGVGCFGKPKTVARVFKKIIESYTLACELAFGRGDACEKKDLRRLLKDVLSECGENICLTSLEKERNKPITGFWLGFENEVLNLSLFARANRQKCNRFAESVMTMEKLGKKRLH